VLRILLPGNERDLDHLNQMHHIRYLRFGKQFGWTIGIDIVDEKAFDKYDTEHCGYLVNVNQANRVDTLVRLIPANQPNYTCDDFMSSTILPFDRKQRIVELSCTSNDKSIAAENSLQVLIGGLLEIGVYYNIHAYVTNSNQSVQSRSKELHWYSTEISDRRNFDQQSFVALQCEVSPEILERFKRANHLPKNLLSAEEIERCESFLG
jgi:N-acyl-L-homoserine lactone synthetase